VSAVDWSRYNLPAIWGLVADVDVCDGADRVLAWDGLASAVRDQHKRLLAAADSLAAVWPPAKNDSASEFQRQVQGLADSMQETLAKAENTKAGLNGVVQAFSTAQAKIRDLASGREGVSNDWMPRFVDHAEDKYDEHAQAAMRDAEAAIGDHSAQIQAPSLYQLTVGGTDETREKLPPGGGGSGGSASGSARPALQARPIPVDVPSDPSSMIPVQSASSDTDPGVSGATTGPVLSGMAPPTTMPSNDPGGLPLTPSGGSLTPSPPIGPGGASGAPVLLPVGGSGSGGISGFGGLPGRGAGGGNRQRLSIRKAMPSGAVIGAESEHGVGTGGGLAGAMPMGAGASGRSRGRSGHSLDGDVHQQWETKEGVAPVIKPDTKPVQHDPGPGVIGFNR
jgi:hypothetical protein